MVAAGQALLVALPALVQGHAYLFFPPMRGGAFNNPNNAYCPQCLGTTSLPMPTCGQSKFLNWADGPVTTLTAGQRVKFTVKMTAHHMGHFQFRLCDRAINSSLGGYSQEEACLNSHVLERVRPEEVHTDCIANDVRGDCQPYDEANPSYWYLPPKDTHGLEYSFHYQLPRGVTCEKCTLQWWWMSANSCTPHQDAYNCYFQKMQQQKWAAGSWCRGACSFSGSCPAVQGPARNCGEQFKNCADVQIRASGSVPNPGPPPPAPSPVIPAPAPVPPPVPPVQPPAPEPEAEAEEEEEETEEEREETPSATPAPTNPPASTACRANPNLNRGVGDRDCQRCLEGYQWWPCNEAQLCLGCTPSLVQTSSRGKAVREHQFLGLIQQGEEVHRDAAFMEVEAMADEL